MYRPGRHGCTCSTPNGLGHGLCDNVACQAHVKFSEVKQGRIFAYGRDIIIQPNWDAETSDSGAIQTCQRAVCSFGSEILKARSEVVSNSLVILPEYLKMGSMNNFKLVLQAFNGHWEGQCHAPRSNNFLIKSIRLSKGEYLESSLVAYERWV